MPSNIPLYLHHVKKNAGNKTYWQNNYNSSAMNNWLGLVFEEGDNENPGTQIDLKFFLTYLLRPW